MKNKRWVGLTFDEWIIGIVILVCAVYFFPRWADPNQNSRLDMVFAVVDQRTFAIDDYVDNTVDFAYFDGHYYSDKPPGTAFLGIPLYAGFKALLNTPVVDGLMNRLANSPSFQSTLKPDGSGVYVDKVRFALAQVILAFFLAVLPTVFLCILLYRLLLFFHVSSGLSFLSALIYGLFTPAFAYSNALYGHQLSAFLLIAALYLITTARSFSVRRLLLIGFLLTFSVVTEYATVLIVLVLVADLFFRLVQFRKWQNIGWVFGMAAIGIAGLMLYNQSIFQNPFSLGYSFSENWTVQHQTGFMSLTFPSLKTALAITFGIFRGLFVLSPVLILAIFGYWDWWKKGLYRREWWVCLSSSILMFLFNSSSSMWWGGFSIGPRYFLAGLPFLALGLGFHLAFHWRHAWYRVIVGLLMIWSFVATWGLSLAGQSFVSDTILNPYLEYALPNWLAGNIARNFGVLIGLSGAASVLPLIFVSVSLIMFWWLQSRNTAQPPSLPGEINAHEGLQSQ